MKTLLIAAAAAATLAAGALPASAQTFDHGRYAAPVARAEFRHDRFVSPWELRRLEEMRRIEWLRHHRHFHDSGFGYRR